MTLSEISRRLVMKYKARLTRPANERTNRIDIIIGDPGIGKSTTMRLLADKLAAVTGKPCRTMMWHVATQGFEDNTGLPIIDEVNEGEHIQKVAKFAKANHVPGAVWWPDGYTIGVLDELPTASIPVQNQIREMIDGQLNGEPLDPNCILLGTGNPPSAEYLTVNALDAAIESRLKVIIAQPSKEELLSVWSDIMPDLIYGFLLTNDGFIGALTPREWVGVAMDAQDVKDGGGTLDDQISEVTLDLVGKADVQEALRRYLKFGNSPEYYPILGRDMVNANAEKMKEYMARLKKWVNDSNDGLLGATTTDFSRVLSKKLTKDDVVSVEQAAQNVIDVIDLTAANNRTDIARSLLDSVFMSGDIKLVVWDQLPKVKDNRILKQFAEVIERTREMQAKEG